MIGKHPGNVAPLPLADAQANALAYLVELVREDPTVRALCAAIVVAPAPYGPGEFDGTDARRPKPAPLPALVVSATPAPGAVLGSGRGGTPTLDRSVFATIQVVLLAKADPGDCQRIWGAIAAAVWGDYRAKLPGLWKRGISALLPIQQANGAERPDPESAWAVATGVIQIVL